VKSQTLRKRQCSPRLILVGGGGACLVKEGGREGEDHREKKESLPALNPASLKHRGEKMRVKEADNAFCGRALKYKKNRIGSKRVNVSPPPAGHRAAARAGFSSYR